MIACIAKPARCSHLTPATAGDATSSSPLSLTPPYNQIIMALATLSANKGISRVATQVRANASPRRPYVVCEDSNQQGHPQRPGRHSAGISGGSCCGLLPAQRPAHVHALGRVCLRLLRPAGSACSRRDGRGGSTPADRVALTAPGIRDCRSLYQQDRGCVPCRHAAARLSAQQSAATCLVSAISSQGPLRVQLLGSHRVVHLA